MNLYFYINPEEEPGITVSTNHPQFRDIEAISSWFHPYEVVLCHVDTHAFLCALNLHVPEVPTDLVVVTVTNGKITSEIYEAY